MLKKRLIFTLLYNNGQFMLSRNFRLQKVGDLDWLRTNYNFSKISFSIDELIILDVTRGEKNNEKFCSALKQLAYGCFVPIAVGGGVNTIEIANNLLRSGADKVVVNSALYQDDGFISKLASEYGKQCIVASIDIKSTLDGRYEIWSESGSKLQPEPPSFLIEQVTKGEIGEIYLNSMDRDGTGQGFDFKLLELLPKNFLKPVILAGGAGNAIHLEQGLAHQSVDAVATANLFNFVGDGLKKARELLIQRGVKLPLWDVQFLEEHLFKEGLN